MVGSARFVCLCRGGGHVCRGRGSEARLSILPVQLPEASNLSVPDLTRTERKRVRPLTGRGFLSPPPVLARLTECLHPSLSQRRGNFSLRLHSDKDLETFRRHSIDTKLDAKNAERTIQKITSVMTSVIYPAKTGRQLAFADHLRATPLENKCQAIWKKSKPFWEFRE